MTALILILAVLPLLVLSQEPHDNAPHTLHTPKMDQLSPQNDPTEDLEDFSILNELQECYFTNLDKLGFPSKLEFNPSKSGDFLALDELNSAHGFGRAMGRGLVSNWFKISKKCRKNVWDFVQGLLGRKKKTWAFQMFDSSSRFPSGLGTGNIVDLGFFDECLGIEATIRRLFRNETVLGKHCIANLPLEDIIKTSPKILKADFFQPDTRVIAAQKGVGLQFSVCIPHTCSARDLELLFFEKFAFYDDFCQIKEDLRPELNGGAIGAISFLGVILAVIAASTIYDIFLDVKKKDASHSLLIAFSLLKNGKKLMKTSTSPDQVSCLHGIRVISTMWVIIVHRYIIQLTFPARNYVGVLRWFRSKKSMFVQNGTLAVDSFFLMSGMVVCYVFLTGAAKGAKFNVLSYYRHRYLRLTPVIAVIILVQTTLFKYFGTGPYFPTTVAIFTPVCQDNWWKTLLYIQNYGAHDTADVCVSQSWYLSVDMQLFLLSPLLLLPLRKWPFHTKLVATFLTLGSMVASFLTGWILELNSYALGNTLKSLDKYHQHYQWYYIATYTRAGPWLIGLVLGYYTFQVKQGGLRVKMHKSFALLMWFLAVLVLCTCVFTGWNMIFEYNRLVHSLHMALVRPAWAIALSWVIFACSTGFGGPVNWFLSLPLFQVVSKLTYTLYLLHFQTMSAISATMRTPPMFGNEEMMHAFWGDFAATFALSVAFTLAIEFPVITLEEILTGKGRKKPAHGPAQPKPQVD